MRTLKLCYRQAVVLLLLGGAALVFALHVGVTGARTPTLGYVAYYTSAWLVVHDGNVDRLYDGRWFIDQTPRAGIDEPRDIFNVNPPPAALLALPLVPFSPADGKVILLLLNLFFLGATVYLVRSAMAVAFPQAVASPVWLPAVAGLALVYTPIAENAHLGQAYGLLLVLVALAFHGYVGGRDRWLGGALGLLLVLKTAGVVLWVIPAMDRRWRALASGALVAGLVAVCSLPLLGARLWWEYPQWLPSLFNKFWTGQTSYQTLASIAHHLTTQHPRYSPAPPFDVPGLAAPLAAIAQAVCLTAAVAVLWPCAREMLPAPLHAQRFATLLALAAPLQPLGEEHHYALMFPSIVVALAAAPRPFAAHPWRVMLTVIGVLLLLAPLEYESERLLNGWWGLLAYPRVYGALLLAGMLAAGVARPLREWVPALRSA